MSNIANEMLPGGGYILHCAEECSETDKEKIFCCVHCGVRVYLHLPEAESDISPYFSAGVEPHKKGCPDYRKDLFQKVAHLDHTGYGIDLDELIAGFRAVDRRPRPEGSNGEGGDPRAKTKEGPTAEENNRPICREARAPRTIIQLYGILKNPAVTEYAGHDVRELVLDNSTIDYFRNHTLNHTAMVVCKRCFPPKEIINQLENDGIYARSLTLRAPYAVDQGQKDLYFVLVHNSADERRNTLVKMKEDSERGGENKPDDKYLAMAPWRPYIESESFRAYIGHLPSTGCIHRLPPKYDCSAE